MILTVLDHPAAAERLLAAALRLAALSDAGHIGALAVRMLPEASISQSEEILTEQREAALRAAEATRVDAVRQAFDRWTPGAQQAGVDAEWLDIDGIPELVVEERGRRADFLVIEQPARHDYGASWQALRAALFATDRPVLVVPRNAPTDFGHRIAIAWRDDERAAKAVLASMHCLASAQRVLVLAGARSDRAPPSMPAILGEHRIDAELHLLPVGSGAFGAALLTKARELGADMMVMGAYQHHPLRELLLGGVTRYMLHYAELPILMQH